MSTLYDAAGIGEKATTIISVAIERANAACKRMLAQPPKPIPEIAECDFPSVDHVTSDSCKVLFSDNEKCYVLLALNDRNNWWRGSVSKEITASTSPEVLLALTEKMERVASECERMADEREDEIKETIEKALDSSDYAIKKLAEGIKSETEEQQERANWIEQHGSIRLKRLVQEGIKHDAVYADERLSADRAGWCYYGNAVGEFCDAINAPIEAFDVLDAARTTASDAQLSYYIVRWSELEEVPEESSAKYAWEGYVAKAMFLNSQIVFGLPSEFH